MQLLVSRSNWERNNNKIKLRLGKNTPFQGILKKNLPEGGDVIELGSVPARFLAFFNRNMGYRVYGVDWTTKLWGVVEQFKKEKIPATFYMADVREFNPNRQFDVVCSFGLVEHFPKLRPILRKHLQLCKKGGYVVITIPNFLKMKMNKRQEREHNLKLMKKNYLKKVAERMGLKTITFEKTKIRSGFKHIIYIGKK